MTTSYELSLKLKELGVEQYGEYYWIDMGDGNVRLAHYQSSIADEYDHACRAFTLGELVRELPEMVSLMKLGDSFIIGGVGAIELGVPKTLKALSPEEAAGELLAAIKEMELKQKQS